MNVHAAAEVLAELLGRGRGGLADEVGASWSAVLGSAGMGDRGCEGGVEVLSLQHPSLAQHRGRREARRDILEVLQAGGLRANVRWVDGVVLEEGLALLQDAPYRRVITEYLPVLEVRAVSGYRSLSILSWTQMMAELAAHTPTIVHEHSAREERLRAEVQQSFHIERGSAARQQAATACQLAQDSGFIPAGRLSQIPASGVHPAGIAWVCEEGLELAGYALSE